MTSCWPKQAGRLAVTAPAEQSHARAGATTVIARSVGVRQLRRLGDLQLMRPQGAVAAAQTCACNVHLLSRPTSPSSRIQWPPQTTSLACQRQGYKPAGQLTWTFFEMSPSVESVAVARHPICMPAHQAASWGCCKRQSGQFVHDQAYCCRRSAAAIGLSMSGPTAVCQCWVMHSLALLQARKGTAVVLPYGT